MKMTPLALEILIHYQISLNNYEDGGYSAAKETIAALEREDMLVEKLPDSISLASYELTERGHVYMNHIYALPFPLKAVRWAMPEYKKGIGR